MIVGAALVASVAALSSSWTTVIAQVSFDRLLRASAGTTELADLFRHYLEPALQPADADHSGKREEPRAAVGVPRASLDKFEATPLVVDGVMYTVQAPNDVVALDVVTGRVFWIYRHADAAARPCCGRVNRGVAILGNTLFMATLDAHLWPSTPRRRA